jgi:hypothetical protein
MPEVKTMTNSDDRSNRDRSPEGRFVYLANKRVPKAIAAIESVTKLSDRKNYSFTEEQVQQIIDAMQETLDQLKEEFGKSKRSAASTFKLT